MDARTHTTPTARPPQSLRDTRMMAGGITRTVKAHLPIDLLEAARARTGLRSDEEVLQAALMALVELDD